jgi:hypothetical protein
MHEYIFTVSDTIEAQSTILQDRRLSNLPATSITVVSSSQKQIKMHALKHYFCGRNHKN